MKRAATAVLLAGGQSTRMGRDKALLPWAGGTLIEHIHAQLTARFEEVLVASGTEDCFKSLGIPGLDDAPGLQGPVAGMSTAFQNAKFPVCYVHPCDTPTVDDGLIDLLMHALAEEFEAAVAETPSGTQPLCAVYRVAPALAAIEVCVQQGAFGLYRVLNRLQVAVVPMDHEIPNLNTPEDLLHFR